MRLAHLKKLRGPLVLGLALSLSLSSCALIRASPIETTMFLPDGSRLLPMPARAPFHGLFIPNPQRLTELAEQYKGIYIKPVDSSYAEARVGASDLPESVKRQRIDEIREMARYFRERVKSAVRDFDSPEESSDEQSSPQAVADALMRHHYEVFDEPGEGRFMMELALVEVIPTNPGIHVVGTIGGFFVPGGGLISYLGTGSVAIEGLIRDGAAGPVLLEFKDRQADKTTPFSVKDFQQYAHARSSIEDWSRQIAELTGTSAEHMVEGTSPVSINPL